MALNLSLLKPVALFVPVALCLSVAPSECRQAGNDLDQFMAQVLARRDDNWRKLQQYVLDERETDDFLGPGRIRLFAMDREYEWYIRDGVFVRSPVKFDGVTLGEEDRRKAEQEWIGQEKDRQKSDAAKSAAVLQGAPAPDTDNPGSLDSILKSTREPQFVSAAYFMRFKFEPGHYAFVGPEIYEGRQVLRIEYYPRRLYDDDGPGHDEGKRSSAHALVGETVSCAMDGAARFNQRDQIPHGLHRKRRVHVQHERYRHRLRERREIAPNVERRLGKQQRIDA